MEQSEVILSANGICKRYVGVRALDNVDFCVRKGEIQCLAGENGSGKSTLVKIIAGTEKPTSGEIVIDGRSYTQLTNSEAISLGIQVIYQDLSLFEYMTVAENIAMNKYIRGGRKLVGKRETEEFAQRILDQIGVSIPLNAPVQELSIANKQVIAICRCLALDAKILFMDEPTTALTQAEIKRLFEIVLGLKNNGMSIVFISHKLNEVMQISDNVTVLRNGKLVGEFPCAEVTEKKLAYYMTGKEVLYPKFVAAEQNGDALIELRELTRAPHYENLNLQIKRKEIVGLIGLMGAGRTELALSLFGLNPPDSGAIIFEDKAVKIKNPADAVALGIGLVPEQRALQGLFLQSGVGDNVVSAMLNRFRYRGVLFNKKAARKVAQDNIGRFGIKTPMASTPAEALSGGNQQKAVIAKWSLLKPKLLILDSPTVGIDIGSKAEVYQIIQDFVKQSQAGVLLISDEVTEVANNCNRIIVMFRGRIVREFGSDELMRTDIEQLVSEAIANGGLPEERTEAEGN